MNLIFFYKEALRIYLGNSFVNNSGDFKIESTEINIKFVHRNLSMSRLELVKISEALKLMWLAASILTFFNFWFLNLSVVPGGGGHLGSQIKFFLDARNSRVDQLVTWGLYEM